MISLSQLRILAFAIETLLSAPTYVLKVSIARRISCFRMLKEGNGSFHTVRAQDMYVSCIDYITGIPSLTSYHRDLTTMVPAILRRYHSRIQIGSVLITTTTLVPLIKLYILRMSSLSMSPRSETPLTVPSKGAEKCLNNNDMEFSIPQLSQKADLQSQKFLVLMMINKNYN